MHLRQDVTNPTLFQTMPMLSEVGTLSATLSEDPTGSTGIVVQAVDNGWLYNARGSNMSEPAIITLRLTTGNALPAFNLPWRTRCAVDRRMDEAYSTGDHSNQTVVASVQCSCSLRTSTPDCQLLHTNLRCVQHRLATLLNTSRSAKLIRC